MHSLSHVRMHDVDLHIYPVIHTMHHSQPASTRLIRFALNLPLVFASGLESATYSLSHNGDALTNLRISLASSLLSPIPI